MALDLSPEQKAKLLSFIKSDGDPSAVASPGAPMGGDPMDDDDDPEDFTEVDDGLMYGSGDEDDEESDDMPSMPPARPPATDRPDVSPATFNARRGEEEKIKPKGGIIDRDAMRASVSKVVGRG